MEKWFNFVSEVGNSFLRRMFQKKKSLSYTPEQKNWQEIRRGRYVEFNLVHDKALYLV
jgi:coproporphyrinogen III oxidase